jgi:hypothetical protein
MPSGSVTWDPWTGSLESFVQGLRGSLIPDPDSRQPQYVLYDTLPPGSSTFSGPFKTNAIADVPGAR